MIRFRFAIPGLVMVGFGAFLLLTQARMPSNADLAGLTGVPAQGEAVFWAAGCASCHVAVDAKGAGQMVLSGGRAFASPFGTFLAPNISTDTKEGIGGWSTDEFSAAIRSGFSPEGQHYFPALPYAAYNKMTPQDLVNLKAWMDGLPASATPSQPHQVAFPFNIRRTLGIWKLLFNDDGYVIGGDLSPQQSRGRYLAEALSHCGECHTPRNALGGLDRSRWLGGAADPSGKGRIPNITPGKLQWSEAEVTAYLTTGFTPDFDVVGGHMAAVVDNMGHLPLADVQAIAAYLKAVPPVE